MLITQSGSHFGAAELRTDFKYFGYVDLKNVFPIPFFIKFTIELEDFILINSLDLFNIQKTHSKRK